MAIAIRQPREIELLKSANKIVAQALNLVKAYAKVGVTLEELDSLAADFIAKEGARASFKGLYGFPKSICLSVNDIVIHGIPDSYALKNGDILGVDIGVEYRGYFGDAAITVGVGEVSQNDERLIACAYDSLIHAIKNIKVGMRFKELSAVIEEFILARGFIPLRGFCGHGIGTQPHEDPQIPNYVESDIRQGPKIKNGMVFCIEPMICNKSGEFEILEDKWSVATKDGLNGSHYEHTVAIIADRAVILSEE